MNECILVKGYFVEVGVLALVFWVGVLNLFSDVGL